MSIPKLIRDACNVALLRFEPLAHYVYPYWQPVFWLCVIGFTPAFFATKLEAVLPARMGFFLLWTWLETILITVFFTWWLQQGKRWNGEGSLFPLMVLIASLELAQPLLLIFPSDLAMSLNLLLLVYQLCVLVFGLAAATGAGLRHVFTGLMIYLPLAVMVWALASLTANWLGWLPMPADVAGVP